MKNPHPEADNQKRNCYWVDDPSPIIWIIYPPTRVGAIYSLLIVPFFFRCQRFLCKIGYLLVFFCCLFRAFFWASCGFLFLLDFLRLFRQVFNKNEEVHALFSQLNGTRLDKKDRLKAIRKALPNSAWDLLCHVTTHPRKKEKEKGTFMYMLVSSTSKMCLFLWKPGTKSTPFIPRPYPPAPSSPGRALSAALGLSFIASKDDFATGFDASFVQISHPKREGKPENHGLKVRRVLGYGIWDIVPSKRPPFWCLDPKVENSFEEKNNNKNHRWDDVFMIFLGGAVHLSEKKLIKWSNMAEMVHFPRDDVW